MKPVDTETNNRTIMAKISEDNVALNNRLAYSYPIVFRYLSKKIDGWSVEEFFHEIGTKRIALYAVTDISRLVIKDLSNCNASIDFMLVDKNYRKFMHKIYGQQVCGVNDLLSLYYAKKIEKIIPCSITYSNEIFNELIAAGVSLNDIISINDVI